MKRIGLLTLAATPLVLTGGTWSARVATPAAPTALITYLRAGTARIALTSDTIVEHGRAVALEQSTFEAVFKMLKPATVNGRGDASTALAWVCYRLRGDTPTSLILESDEMGGGEYVDGFELVPVGGQPDLERDCVDLDLSPSDIETDKGIRLGLTRLEVRKRLGVAGRDSAGVVVFERNKEKSNRLLDGTRERYNEWAAFTIRFRDGRAAEVTGWRIDST
jgi:hypothetical protein